MTDEADRAAAIPRPEDFGIGRLFWRIREAVVVGDARTGRIVLWNPAAEVLFGYWAEEARGRPIEILVPERLKPHHRAGLAEYAATGHGTIIDGGRAVEVPALRKDGEEVAVELSLSPIETTAHQGAFVLAVIRDVTERKRAEEARLRLEREQAARVEAARAAASRAFLAEAGDVLVSSLEYEVTLQNVARLVVSHLADYCVVDIVGEDDSIQRLAVAHADPAKEPLALGLRRFPPRPTVPEGTPKAIRTGEAQLVNDVSEDYLRASTAGPEHLRIHLGLGVRAFLIVPLAARGRILGSMTLASARPGRRFDADDLALAQELARRAALAIDNARLYREAQEAIHRRDEFVTIAAHELKTPLTSLLVHAQLGLRQLEKERGAGGPPMSRTLDRINLQASKLARLIDNLLDITRFDAGRLRPEQRPIDLIALVREVLAATQATTSQHTFELRGPAELRVVADPLRLEQVLNNLLDNAAKYSPDGGPIEVEIGVRTRESGVGADSQRALTPASLLPTPVFISVRDHGLGILPERRDRIFERFYQAHPEHYRSGMGLGLYVSRAIVELHGGELTAEFPADGGSRFIVRLPLPPAVPPDLAPTAP